MKHPQYYLRDAIPEYVEDVRFRNDYSGRGMYGKRCVGISGSMGECQGAIAEAIVLAGIDSQKVQMGSSREETDEFYRQLVHTLLNYSEDSMGMGVILYWPQLEAIPGDE